MADEQTLNKFKLCSPPMRRYMEQMFACGEYHEVVQIAQAELRENPYNLDMILYQAICVLELQAREMAPAKPDLVSRAVNQLHLLTDLILLVDVPMECGLEYYLALGNLLLGNVDKADQHMMDYAMQSGAKNEMQAQYARFRAYWGGRAPDSPRKWRTNKTYVS